ncbi:hypothetical protein [Candidatus Hodgkinia cicadicola]|uniref:hypothetical protein n=1 Tax=Candidatus Hodgkinia cicadicola TaxID=573658 RepID=UPI001788A5EC
MYCIVFQCGLLRKKDIRVSIRGFNRIDVNLNSKNKEIKKGRFVMRVLSLDFVSCTWRV